jgi:hypothetical protein
MTADRERIRIRCHSSAMWVDDTGVAHAVALPNPAGLMSDEFRVSVAALVASSRPEVEVLLETVEERLFDLDLSGLTVEGVDEFEGVIPPQKLLCGSVATLEELGHRLEQVEVRWRLDAVLALGDYIY